MSEQSRGREADAPEDDDGSGGGDFLGLGERHSYGLWVGGGGGGSDTHHGQGRRVFIQPEGSDGTGGGVPSFLVVGEARTAWHVSRPRLDASHGSRIKSEP
jgi:hypothetical protein